MVTAVAKSKKMPRTLKENIEWQRRFVPEMKRIWREVLKEYGDVRIVEASFKADVYEATDMIAMAAGLDIRLACRVRSYHHYLQFPDDFTIRNHGVVTELEKIVDQGFGDYYLYAFADKQERNLISWFVGDLRVFRKEYKHAQRVNALRIHQRKIEWTEVDPDSGSPFIAFKVETFLPQFVVASYNYKHIPRR